MFYDMFATSEVAYVGFDGRTRCDDEALEFESIKSCEAVDHGWEDCDVLDFKRMENNM